MARRGQPKGRRPKSRIDERSAPPPAVDHGAHTLRVWQGVVVGVDGDDVFVELGPRMQGVLSRRRFDEQPRPGDTHDFTVLGQEDGLWALARVEEGVVGSWRDMEPGSWVQGRVTGVNHGGLELRIGPLHAFMPRSECGLARDQKPRELVGTTTTCEVIEVDSERQRVLVSRKRVLKEQRESQEQRQVSSLKPGQVVTGRVSRIEPYGVFVRFGAGLEGLVHISNLSLERVEHPGDVVELGETVEAKVLTIRRAGKRVGLGLKQMHESPWKALERTHHADQVVEGSVTRLADFGAFVSIARGVEGLLHESQSGLPAGRRLRDRLRVGARLVVRIEDFDVDAERMSLSRLRRDGSQVDEDDLLSEEARAELEAAADGGSPAGNGRATAAEAGGGPVAGATTNLGRLIRGVLGPQRDAPSASSQPVPKRSSGSR